MAGMEPSRIIIIRHGEKSLNKTDNHLQMPKGYERAAALAPFLRFRFKNIDALYAPGLGPSKQSLRVVETITPLSLLLNLLIQTTYFNSKDDIQKMVKFIQTNPKYQGKTILICWHHNQIPFLTKVIKPSNIDKIPDCWPNDRFDLIWMLRKTSKGILFSQEPQKLLYGDKVSVIPRN